MTAKTRPEDIGRRLWEDRHGNLAIERDRWRAIAFATLGLTAVALGLSVYAAVTSRYIPYIVFVDELNQPQAALAPKSVTEWPEAVVKQQLGTLVRQWRSVSTDGAVMRGRLRRLQFFLESGSVGDTKIVEWADQNDPFRRAETETVDVAMAGVTYLGGRSWFAEWTETRRRRNTGRIEAVTRWQGTFTLAQRRVRDDTILLQNPLGMVIEDWDVVRVE
ncbi:MAG: VirB8/TrbF family protein [Aestuariivita sp.]|nr:VirB8/TrbF family protein [Aestuariivita sp.]MCY4345388.1 VirB8/TrbF family protein [Aestuariivita sp.]